MFVRRVEAADRVVPGAPVEPLGRKSKWQRFRFVQQRWWAYNGFQQAALVAVLALCMIVVVVTSTAMTATRPQARQKSSVVRHTYVDVQRSQAEYGVAVSELRRLEQAAMMADRMLTDVYKQRTTLLGDAFDTALSKAKRAVRVAEDAVAVGARIAEAKRTHRDAAARAYHHDRSMEEVGVYVSWAMLHVSNYGTLRVSTPRSLEESVAQDDPLAPRFVHAVENELNVEDVKGLAPLHPALTCELMILGVEACDTGCTTYIDCVLMYGLKAWSTVLLPQCQDSVFWQSLSRFLRSKFPRVADVGVRHRGASEGSDGIRLLLMDKIQRASMPSNPPVLRETWGSVHPAHYGPPLQCAPASTRDLPAHAAVQRVYPLSYGITSQYFARTVTQRKLIDWYPILPALKPLTSRPVLPTGVTYRMSYSLGDVDEYLNTLLLRYSRFAWSHIRGGPDSMRHYEIMSQGTIPYFIDLDACVYKPCLANLPTDLLRQATQLPGVRHIPLVNDSESSVRSPYFYRMSRQEVNAAGEASKFTHVVNFVQRGDIRREAFDAAAYHQLASEVLAASRRATTCASVVKSLLVRAGFASVQSLPTSILFVSFPHTDYMTYTIECGLAELGLNYTVNYRFGTAYVDDDEHLMRPIHRNPNASTTSGRAFMESVQARRSSKSYGLGFATAQKINLPPNPIPATQEELCRRVRGSEFDLYVVAWKSHRFLQDSCFEDAVATIGTNRVIVVDGEDQDYQPNLTRYVLRGIKVFSREARCDLLE